MWGNKQVCQAYHLLLGKNCVSENSALNRVWTWPEVIPSALHLQGMDPVYPGSRAIFSLSGASAASRPAFKSLGLKCTVELNVLRRVLKVSNLSNISSCGRQSKWQFKKNKHTQTHSIGAVDGQSEQHVPKRSPQQSKIWSKWFMVSSAGVCGHLDRI